MPYREPEVLRFHGTGGPIASFVNEDTSELQALCRIWDSSGLLGITAGPLPDRQLTRVFAAFKAPGKQRQIGDRRGQNSLESQLTGPSRFLPTGPQLCLLTVPRNRCLVGSVTDRRDFYTQAKVTPQRQESNAIGPAMTLACFRGTRAYDDWVGRALALAPRRAVAGIDAPRPALGVLDEQLVHPTFAALLQGDAGGVEFATAAHEGLLLRFGCLQPHGRLQGKHHVGREGPWQGLIIDDFFCLATEAATHVPGDPSVSSACVARAKEAYQAYQILGSDDKDVLSQRCLRVAGAEIDSSPKTVREGATLVSYPADKRLSLAAASVRAAALPALSEELVSILSGSWVSCLLYRRCLMSVLDGLFGLGKKAPAEVPNGSALRPLSRKVAGELQILAVLAPIISTNVSAAPTAEVYATDASLKKGAVVAAKVPEDAALDFWLSSDFKGSPVRLDGKPVGSKDPNPGEAFQAGEELGCPEEDFSSLVDVVPKPPACAYDCLVVGPGSQVFVDEAVQRGLTPSPAIDFQRSSEYDLASPHLREWLVHLVSSRVVKSAILWPACASFSPCFGSSLACSRRRGPSDPRPRDQRGAATCLVVLLAAARAGVPAVLLQPATSSMSKLAVWGSIASRAGCYDYELPSGPGLRLRLLSCHMPVLQIRAPPAGVNSEDARWLPNVNEALCGAIVSLCASGHDLSAAGEVARQGLHNVAVNDLLIAAPWVPKAVWTFSRPMHINVLECLAALKAIKITVLGGGDRRIPIFLDSSVARGALAKGRSSSRQLRKVLLKAAAWLVCGGTYAGYLHAPTSLNTADDPTRSRPIRAPASSSLILDLQVPASALCGFSDRSLDSAFSSSGA